jgi:hypothetical protein
MILHCPCCHAQFSVEAITQDEAARELLGLKGDLPPATFSYLALFRSEKRALSWERALRLVKEILALVDGGGYVRAIHESPLQVAMMETVEALRGKGGAPLKNHNYLKRVMESRVANPPALSGSPLCQRGDVVGGKTVATSKTDAAMSSLEAWSRG